MHKSFFSLDIGSLLIALATFFSAYMVMRKIKKQYHEKKKYEQYNRIVDAYKEFWSLSKYLSDLKINPDRLIYKDGKEYFVTRKNAEKFIKELNELLYSEAGYFMSQEIRNKFYYLRRTLDYILNGPSTDEEINVTDDKELKKMHNAIKEIPTLLREKLNKYSPEQLK